MTHLVILQEMSALRDHCCELEAELEEWLSAAQTNRHSSRSGSPCVPGSADERELRLLRHALDDAELQIQAQRLSDATAVKAAEEAELAVANIGQMFVDSEDKMLEMRTASAHNETLLERLQAQVAHHTTASSAAEKAKA